MLLHDFLSSEPFASLPIFLLLSTTNAQRVSVFGIIFRESAVVFIQMPLAASLVEKGSLQVHVQCTSELMQLVVPRILRSFKPL